VRSGCRFLSRTPAQPAPATPAQPASASIESGSRRGYGTAGRSSGRAGAELAAR
jgi:hypothetical protein